MTVLTCLSHKFIYNCNGTVCIASLSDERTQLINIFLCQPNSGDGLPAIIILGMGFIPCNRTIAVVLYTAAMTINGVAVAGPQSNLFDIAPKYAGIIFIL